MSLFGRKKRNTFPYCSVVVAAAGASNRMEGQDKMFSELNGVPVLAHTLMVLQACPMIHEIVVVTRSDLIPAVGDLCRDFGIEKATGVVVGGAPRLPHVLYRSPPLGFLFFSSQDRKTLSFHPKAQVRKRSLRSPCRSPRLLR